MVSDSNSNSRVMHNNSLQLFNELIFHDVLADTNLVGKKKAITINEQKYYGYFFERNRLMYFLEDSEDETKSVLKYLPIKVTKKLETDYNKQVFYLIREYNSIKIPELRKLSFKMAIDELGKFNHTNPTHWLLYKIICTSAWCSRINFRIIAERGFGKDSVINNLKDLLGDTANIYGATFAKLEYSLTNKFLVFNEMGNLKKDDIFNMQLFLLAIGAMSNSYSKKSRATDTTREEYDISKNSLAIVHNPPSYYIERGQLFFDTMFTQAVLNRFIPFYMEGVLSEKFDAEFDTNQVVSENMELYKNIISTLRWYRNQHVTNQFTNSKIIMFGDGLRRFERSFLKICDFISEYSKDCEEPEKTYKELTEALYNSYLKYETVLADSKVGQINKSNISINTTNEPTALIVETEALLTQPW